MKEKLDDWAKQYLYCDALLLQFREPKCFDLEIPDSYNIYSLVNLSLRVLSREKISPSEINCISTCHDIYENLISIKKLEKVLKDEELSTKLFDTLKEPRDEPSLLKLYLCHYENRFGSEWHCMKGDWYRFRLGEREKAERRVSDYLPTSHIEKIKLIGDTFQPYIGLTDSACKCK